MKEEFIQQLKGSGIGILPTDTLYGLVGSAFSKSAVERIYKIKKRNPKKPSIILISSLKDLELFDIKITKDVKKILNKYWPGKVSIILPYNNVKHNFLTCGTKSLAFRMPNDKKLFSILKKTGPLIAPSANPEGKKPAETISQAKIYFSNKIDFYIDSGKLKSLPSTLIKIEDGRIQVLREGAVKIKTKKCLMTLGFIQKENKILLGLKKLRLGKGRWNGFGGRVEKNESVEQGMKRELKEECSLSVKKLLKLGINAFHFKHTQENFEVHIFKITDFSGTPRESDEMKPRWFAINKIPFSKMWPDDKFWLPLFLQDKKFKGKFEFEDYNKIISHKIREVKKLL